MNKILGYIAFSIAFIICAATPPDNKKTLANVKQNNGLYVFIESQPVAEYETLGTVKKTGLVMSNSGKEMVKILTNRAKKDYPSCDGIIFDDLELDHATAIKFK